MRYKTAQQLRAFEQRVADEFAKGTLPFLIHLSGGNEEYLIDFFDTFVKPGDWVLSTHRNHYHYLLAGGDEDRLFKMIQDGRSMFVFDRLLNFASSSILAGLTGVAAGIAHELARSNQGRGPGRRHVWCFLGDGAEDNGHLYEAALWANGLDLPVDFIIEDNDRSVDVPISQRTGGARFPWPSKVTRQLYTPTWPHAGAGLKTMVEFDPLIVKSHAQPTFPR